MNTNMIVTEIQKDDNELFEKIDTRRNAMKQFAGFAGKVAVATIPLALGSMFKKAYGQSVSQKVLDVLNFALTLEYLEAEFYQKGVASSGLIATADTMAFQTIAAHEMEHVDFIKATITALGGTPVAKPEFDFTAKGTFSDVFSNYDTFLAVSQAFEDTGVRAYKGQAGNLMSSNEVLRAALQIHSVEARHAAHVREIRSRKIPDGGLQPWITLNQRKIASAATQPVYNGEENTVQAAHQVFNINRFPIDREDASEAFYEPLTKEQVLAIVTPFIK